MRPKLKDYARPAIERFIRDKFEETGGRGVVVGLSGGIDSAVVSKLCANAIGEGNVTNLFLPCGTSRNEDMNDVEMFCKEFGMELKVVDISPAVEAFRFMLPSSDRKELLGNVMASIRMVVLLHNANLLGKVVMGTSNKSELLTGYFTKFGDGGTDFCPIGDLYKTEVRELAHQIGIPKNMIEKAPTAGLWEGQTDEDELGMSYDEMDQILFGIERFLSAEEISLRTGIDMIPIKRIWELHKSSVHKRKMPLIPKLGIRTLGVDWRE